MTAAFMVPLQTILLFVALLSGELAAEIMIGRCNKTEFSRGSSLCQRIAVENLKLINGTTCEAEYSKQIACLTSHVTKCVLGTQIQLVLGPIVDLLKHVVFNCGSVSGTVMPELFQILRCTSGSFLPRTVACWSEFASQVKTNQNDSTLCLSFASAKHCVANETNTNCPEVSMDHDNCNPFCVNGSDDNRTCPGIPTALKCGAAFYYEKEKACEKTFIEAMTGNTKTLCSTELPKLTMCLDNHYKGCFYPRVDNALLQKLDQAVLSATKGKRLFCNATPLDPIALPSIVRDIVPCNTKYFTEAENCANGFREKFVSNRKDESLCSAYATSKACLYEAQAQHCQHSQAVVQTTNDTYNPFCEGNVDPGNTTSAAGIVHMQLVTLVFSSLLLFLKQFY